MEALSIEETLYCVYAIDKGLCEGLVYHVLYYLNVCAVIPVRPLHYLYVRCIFFYFFNSVFLTSVFWYLPFPHGVYNFLKTVWFSEKFLGFMEERIFGLCSCITISSRIQYRTHFMLVEVRGHPWITSHVKGVDEVWHYVTMGGDPKFCDITFLLF